jgi:hypothetical protein
MSVKIMVGGQMKVVADVISTGTIARIGSLWKIYSGSEWLECDGSAISRSTYADLFAAIGITYGSGDGVNTFSIPTQAQAIRVPFSVTADTAFDQFTSDADVVVNNPSAAFIDISAGAVCRGICISITEQSSQGVTIYQGAGHTQSCTLQKGTVTLLWDGTKWVCVSARGAGLKWVLTSGSSATWTAPFSGDYVVTVVGGGGAGGSASTGSGGGGGGGGGAAIKRYALVGSTGYTYTVGGAAATSSFAGPGATITGGGGAAGGSTSGGGAGGAGGTASNGDTNHKGGGGGAGGAYMPGDPGWPGLSGAGGHSMFGGGGRGLAGGESGAGVAGGSYGGGGGGGGSSGGAGAAGVIIIEWVA